MYVEICILNLLGVDAKQAPAGAVTSDVAGVRNATSGSWTDKLTREHRMTLDEAHLILNTKREDGLEKVLKVRIPNCYSHCTLLYFATTFIL